MDLPGRVRLRSAASGIPAANSIGRGVAAFDGTLVVIHLVGGVDGLSVVVPWGDSAYRKRRPDIGVASPKDRYGAIDLGRGLGLHPALSPLFDGPGRAERLAVIGGVGMPDSARSAAGERCHLPARAFLYGGGHDEDAGWASRLLRFEDLREDAVWSFGTGQHPIFDGAPATIATRPLVNAVADSALGPLVSRPAPAATPSPRWSNTSWSSAGDRLARGYPEGALGRSLAVTIDMIRQGRGPRVVAIDQDGYDTHVDQGDGRSGVLAQRLDQLARALAAFWHETEQLAPLEQRGPVTVVVVSEFGRTIDQNNSGGTDHGRGGVALVLGDEVVGGVHGDYPDLNDDEVWPVSVDTRRILADAVASHGFRPWRGSIFPALPLPNRSLGLLLSP